MELQQQILSNIEKLSGHMATLATNVKGINERMDKQEEHTKSLETAIAEYKLQLEAQKSAGKTRVVGVPGTELKNDGRDFSFCRAARGIVFNDWRGAEYEHEIFRMTDEARNISPAARAEWQKRVMSGEIDVSQRADPQTTQDDTLGGYVVPTQVLSQFFIDLLRPQIIVEALGATVMDNLEGSPVEIPRQVGGATAYWTPENGLIQDSNIQLGQIALQPRQIAALVKLSSRLLRLSTPSAETLVRRDMSRAIAEKFDLAALRGSGSNGEPLGVANSVGINTIAIDTNGGRFNFTHADQQRQALAVDNALTGTLGYAMHPTVSGKLRRERIAQYSSDLEGAYVTLPMSDASLSEQLGFTWKETTQIPTNLTKGSGVSLSEVYFGNWSELIIGMWLNLELAASNQAGDSFQRNQTWIKATMEGDVQLRHLESFCLISDAESAGI